MAKVTYRYGGARGRRLSLSISDDFLVVRTKSRRPVERAPLSAHAREVLDDFYTRVSFGAAGVEVRRCTKSSKVRALRDHARTVLKAEEDVEFAGRVLCDLRSKKPVLYTENLFAKLDDDVAASGAKKLFKGMGLKIKEELSYARNAWFLEAPEGSGLQVFELAEQLLQDERVLLCHPELIREKRHRATFPQQWHLKKTTIGGRVIDQHAHVEAAWSLSEGDGVTIAVIDDGVDLEHEEFGGSNKIVAPRDVTRRSDNPRPHNGNNHGTACAGVACANGLHGASGVAPRARLLPIRLMSGLGSQAEADAFVWAADHGADVISCSWGPVDGNFTNPNDPTHQQVVPLPDSTRLAIDYATENGRNGKGCVICWAAGNGNEPVDNDGYASYERVIAVAACNDQGKKAPYSDFGNAVWCAFPSDNVFPSLTPGIWTTDRMGLPGYSTGNYADDFGGTSSACPGAAGVAALVLARSPELRWDQVKDVLRHCADRIDAVGGSYDAQGHSPLFGYGRLNAVRAVELAVGPSQP
jgi:subtilisin family serine protease